MISLLLVLLLPSQWLMVKTPLYHGFDVLTHIERIKEFHAAILEGQFPPRLAPSLINGATYPLFIVNYQLPYFLTEALFVLTSNPVLAFKLVMSLTYILSAIFAWKFFRTFASPSASLAGSIVFSYLPYRFNNLYHRGALGESIALMFVPLVFLGLSTRGALLALAVFGLISSHTVIFIMFLPFFLGYLYVIKPSISRLKSIIISFCLGVLLSASQWLPAIFEKPYFKFDLVLNSIYSGHFINFFQLFRLPFTNLNMGTYFQAGIIAFIILLFGLHRWMVTKHKPLAIALLAVMVSTFLITRFSNFFWANSPLPQTFFYPWRFLSVITFASALIAVYALETLSPKVRCAVSLLLIMAVIITSRHYWLSSGHAYQPKFSPTLTAYNEADPIWADTTTFTAKSNINSTFPTTIQEISITPFRLQFTASPLQNTTLVINRLYFPGWQVEANGQPVAIRPQTGLIAFNLPAGNWHVSVKFTDTIVRRLANIFSLVGLGGLLWFLAKKR